MPEKIEKERTSNEQEDSKKSNFISNNAGREDYRTHSYLREVLEINRPVKVTKGGRRFSFTRLVLIKDESSKAVAYAYSGGKEAMIAFRKALRKAQKKLITYF